jgi:hypothetical protein
MPRYIVRDELEVPIPVEMHRHAGLHNDPLRTGYVVWDSEENTIADNDWTSHLFRPDLLADDLVASRTDAQREATKAAKRLNRSG